MSNHSPLRQRMDTGMGMDENTTGRRTTLSFSEDETHRLGVLLGRQIAVPFIIALTGDLGAGKTRFAQGIARGVGVSDSYYITSPSFSMVNQYPGRLDLYHIDLYRIADFSELEQLGIDEILTSDSVSVIEWAERLGSALPKKRLDISIEIVEESTRRFCFNPHGASAHHLVDVFFLGMGEQ